MSLGDLLDTGTKKEEKLQRKYAITEKLKCIKYVQVCLADHSTKSFFCLFCFSLLIQSEISQTDS